ncbi:V-set and immunoglobulin domain-containing protein 10 [Lampris incognitus]|uniref:V-set and immunoglobulin domain-containing protein 10 n=1 Tax=Lampris incognitus TaxID=2546036 RepID=UPI0024B58F25|nr:V-set and immunoglobulin domain-containing protein 10 [Lampris incognitus]
MRARIVHWRSRRFQVVQSDRFTANLCSIYRLCRPKQVAMKVATSTALLQLYLYVTGAAVSGEGVGAAALGELGDGALLPCYPAGNATPIFTWWTRNGQEIIHRDLLAPPPTSSAGEHFLILDNGSLRVDGVTLSDEGTYVCGATFPNSSTQTSVQLQVAGGPQNVSTSISPATTLPNGTFIVSQGSNVSFNCSSSSYPSQNLSWVSPGNRSLVSGGGSWLDFRIKDVQPSDQGEYICGARNSLSHRTASQSTQLLVYYTPNRHPECLWKLSDDPSHVQFNCSWFGAYPTPTLLWGENHHGQGVSVEGHLYVSEETESLAVMLNRSLLFDGQMLKCMAHHPVLAPGQEASCLFTLKPPYPEGEPLVTALEGTNVTLVCTETSSLPPATTVWKRGTQQEDFKPGPKYVLSGDGPVFKLTIVNVSNEDEGVYFCRSENPLSISELEVYLTVKTSSAYTGAIIGIFLAILIVGSGAVIAKTLYSSRDRVCLGTGFGRLEEDRGDVLSLVESDEEEIFQDAVPRLPPTANGHQTTLVQIHRIPSSEHDDSEMAEASPQQQEDMVQTKEPVELVQF